MEQFQPLLLEIKDQVAILTLNRPELHNAFNEILISELHRAIKNIGQNPEVRVVIITGTPPSFCAGADLNWMKKMLHYSKEENIEDAQKLHQMLYSIAQCPKPVIAKVNGSALGGGVGIAAAADISFAYSHAQFGLSEARLGLLPAVISPFVLRKIGVRAFREFALTAERFRAVQAKEMGLIQHCGEPQEIDDLVQSKIESLKAGGPEALASTKQLILEIESLDLERSSEVTARFLAERRISAEGQEGMEAFFQKRKAAWITKR